MKKISILLVSVFLLGLIFPACNNGKTYAELKEEERDAINRFIDKEGIKVISLDQFKAQDSTTNVKENEFVLFSDNGVYMQIIERGNGEELKDGRHEILARYMETQILESGEQDTLSYNTEYTYPEDMMVTKSGKNYQGTFTSGTMTYYGAAVPSGWLLPMNYLRIGREISGRSKIRLIVPHGEGTITASSRVYPCYYEITYQLAR